jgi:DNA-binding MarR family transcriptional regulator
MLGDMSFIEDEDDDWPPLRSSPIDVRVIGSVHGAYQAMKRRLEVATREHGLDACEALVLAAIWKEPGCAPLDVRRRLGFHRSTLSSLLDRLERDGLINRPTSGFNGQRFELELTNSGRIAADVADLVIAAVEEELATYTSLAERRAALAVFEACVAIDRPGRPIR